MTKQIKGNFSPLSLKGAEIAIVKPRSKTTPFTGILFENILVTMMEMLFSMYGFTLQVFGQKSSLTGPQFFPLCEKRLQLQRLPVYAGWKHSKVTAIKATFFVLFKYHLLLVNMRNVQWPAVAMVHTNVRSISRLPDVLFRIIEWNFNQ